LSSSVWYPKESRDNPFGIDTRPWIGVLGVRIPIWARDFFSFSKSCPQCLWGAYPASYWMRSGILFSWG